MNIIDRCVADTDQITVGLFVNAVSILVFGLFAAIVAFSVGSLRNFLITDGCVTFIPIHDWLEFPHTEQQGTATRYLRSLAS
jgi:hypothetical protein